MKEYIFTSSLFTGFMRFSYDADGILIRFENSAIVNDKQMVYLKEHFPFVIDELEKIVGKSGKIIEVSDISFDAFWKEYDYKKGRANAEKEWKKLSEGDRIRAISRIRAYRYDCKLHNRDMVYAERYLKHRRFEDE